MERWDTHLIEMKGCRRRDKNYWSAYTLSLVVFPRNHFVRNPLSLLLYLFDSSSIAMYISRQQDLGCRLRSCKNSQERRTRVLYPPDVPKPGSRCLISLRSKPMHHRQTYALSVKATESACKVSSPFDLSACVSHQNKVSSLSFALKKLITQEPETTCFFVLSIVKILLSHCMTLLCKYSQQRPDSKIRCSVARQVRQVRRAPDNACPDLSPP